MSVISELIFSYTSICLAGISCLLFIFFNFVRNYAYITVNCWFCNTNFKIPVAIKDEWFCEHCQQFNGFKDDGDYSRILPAQFSEALNQRYARPQLLQNKHASNTNGLCNVCNINQELKIKQLAMYVPFREENYDEEVEEFREKLEKSYKLCTSCENLVKKVLQHKSSSSLFTAKTACIIESNGCQKNSKKTIKKSWTFVLLASLLVILIAVASEVTSSAKWKTVLSLFHYFGSTEMELFQLQCGTVSDILFAVCVGVSTRNIFPSGQPIIAVVLIAFVLMMSEDLLPLWKVLVGCVLMFFWSVKHFIHNWEKIYVKPSEFRSTNRVLYQNKVEEDRNIGIKCISQESFSNCNIPLCGKFSNMNLGTSNEFGSKSPKHSYLLKPSRLLIEPSKLKIDDPYDFTDKSRTSPATSSGYESITSSFKKNPDTVSEFDSVSQVGCSRRNNHSWFVENSSYCYALETCRLDSTERYCGVSPCLKATPSPSSSSDPPHIHVDAKVPVLQIVLCSIMCFVLGFTFQMFIGEVYFY